MAIKSFEKLARWRWTCNTNWHRGAILFQLFIWLHISVFLIHSLNTRPFFRCWQYFKDKKKMMHKISSCCSTKLWNLHANWNLEFYTIYAKNFIPQSSYYISNIPEATCCHKRSQRTDHKTAKSFFNCKHIDTDKPRPYGGCSVYLLLRSHSQSLALLFRCVPINPFAHFYHATINDARNKFKAFNKD